MTMNSRKVKLLRRLWKSQKKENRWYDVNCIVNITFNVKDKEIKQLYEEIDRLQKIKQDNENQLRLMSRFTKFLEGTVYEDITFENISDIITRHNVLKKINGDLIKSVERNEAETEALKNGLAKFIKEKQNEILVLNGKVIQTKQNFEKAQHEKVTREQEVYETEGVQKEKVSISCNTKLFCYTLQFN